MSKMHELHSPMKSMQDSMPDKKFGKKGVHGNLGKDVLKEMGNTGVRNPLTNKKVE